MTSKKSLSWIQPRGCAVFAFLWTLVLGVGWGASAPAAPLPTEPQAAFVLPDGWEASAPAATPAPLPTAQEALDKGFIAAKTPDYLLAIRYFEEARKLAPAAPEVFYNLGLAESKIPGRELRAICWFGAYIEVCPQAPNAAAVKKAIGRLEVKSRIHISGLIKSVQKASSISGDSDSDLHRVADLLAKSGDVAGAQKVAKPVQDALSLVIAQLSIADAQVRSGDLPGAQITWEAALLTAHRLDVASTQSTAFEAIAQSQVTGGDIAGAMKIADSLQGKKRDQTLRGIAYFQAKNGDIARARETADLIQDRAWESVALSLIASAQAESDDFTGAEKTFDTAKIVLDLVRNADQKKQAGAIIAEAKEKAFVINAPGSVWLKKLDDSNGDNECALNTEPFLDLAGYLKSLPPSDDPEKMFTSFQETATKIITAQNVITGMLKQQARK